MRRGILYPRLAGPKNHMGRRTPFLESGNRCVRRVSLARLHLSWISLFVSNIPLIRRIDLSNSLYESSKCDASTVLDTMGGHMNQYISEANRKLGSTIRAARHRSGFTVKEAAIRLGLTEHEILRIEREPARIPLNRLSMVISLYGASRCDLIEAVPLVTQQ